MKLLFTTLVILSSAFPGIAQDVQKLDTSVFTKQRGDCQERTRLIDAERKRLGDRFEKELMNYLGEDVDRHEFVACCLGGCCNEPDDPVDPALASLSL
jgi:hypothetical protein